MKHSMTKRILVAGGGGFLGINLCKNLLEEGHDVICLDNFSSGSKSNLELVSSFRNFTLLEQDVTDPINENVDEIYNMACVASPVQYQADPLQTIRTSTEGINNLLKLAVAKKARIFQSSTSEIYGNPHVHPQQEDYFGNVNPIGPRACYDEGKRCAETLCMDYHRMFNVDVKIARIFNTYGPYMQPNDGRVVSNFIVQALMNQPITIYGGGSQTRSFCYVDDMIAGIKALMKTPKTVVGPVNLGNPGEFTVLELASKVIEMTDSSSRIQFYPLPQDDPIKRRPDITRANRLLNWQPRIKLEQGLAETIHYFDKLLNNNALIAATHSATAQIGVANPRINMER